MHVLGVHIEGRTLKVALLHKEKRSFRIDLLRSFPLQEEESVKLLYILAPILAKKKVKIVSALKASDMIIRELEMKLENEKAIRNALPFQIESLLPYPIEESIVLPYFQKSKGSTHITLFATTEALLKKHLDEASVIGIDPDQVSCIPSALHRLIEFLFSSHASLRLLVHFEEKQTIFCYLEDKKMVAVTSLPIGKTHFLQALHKDAKDHEEAKKVDLFSIDSEDYPELFQCKEQFKKDLKRLLSFFESKSKLEKGGECLLSGDILSYFHFRSFFERCLGDEFSILSFSPQQNHSSQEIQSFAIPIGLGLDGLIEDGKEVQFRQENFIPNAQMQKRKKQLITYCICCFVLCAFTFGLSTFFVKKKETLLQEKLHAYLQVKDSGKELIEELDSWEDDLNKKKRPYSYLPSVPKVSDVLGWLSTHPKLLCKADEKIEIVNLKYFLVKYPKLGETTDPYQAKIEMEIHISSPVLANAFRESLQKGEGLVNEKKEIEWKVSQNNYRTSFFLKNVKMD